MGVEYPARVVACGLHNRRHLRGFSHACLLLSCRGFQDEAGRGYVESEISLVVLARFRAHARVIVSEIHREIPWRGTRGQRRSGTVSDIKPDAWRGSGP